jgi:LacI family transcriptional regulator
MLNQKQHITIHDIAKELGVSASTVSRALKNNPRISESTREAVRKLAEKYDYSPNAIAASLRMGKGNTVGVIVPNIHRSFFSTIIGGIEEVLSQAGYNLMICQSNEKLEKEKAAISTLLDARVDAILMSLSIESENYDHIEELLNRKIKMVFFDRIPVGLPVHSVVIDDFIAAYRITEHLLKQGCLRPANIGGSNKINVYEDRRRGFLKAVADFGISIHQSYVLDEEMTLEGGQRAFRKLMALKEPPDAIMCSGDFTALGVILTARNEGISIPEGLAVSGFANEDFTGYITPTLTTIDQRGEEIGRKVANKFLSINDTDKENKTVIEPEILYRESTQFKTLI